MAKEYPRGTFSLVVTDGAANMVAAHSAIRLGLPSVSTSICASHVIHNFFKDVGNIVEVDSLISKGKTLNAWLSCHEPSAKLRKHSKAHLKHELGIVQPSEVRFGAFFIMLHRHHRLAAALTALIAEPKFVADAAKTGKAAEKEHKQLKECIAIIKVRQ